MTDLSHFENLRSQINHELKRRPGPHTREQIDDYPWLYGAIGAVPSDVMFICESPSLAGVQKAHVQTIDDGPPDIEAQWWGGPNDSAARRFRPVLCECALKQTGPRERGGWKCYITNVAKEANIAGAQNALSPAERRDQARRWAPVLRWEIECVTPGRIFCVGGRSDSLVAWLQSEGHLPKGPTHRIWHYSARRGDDLVKQRMREGIQAVLDRPRADTTPTRRNHTLLGDRASR